MTESSGSDIAIGVCSVTFRSLPAEEVIELAIASRIESIEWGADIHVPVGAFSIARGIADRSADAGIRVASYGTYFRAGVSSNSEIAAILDTAEILGAPRVRVWAGEASSAATGATGYARSVEALQLLGDAALERGISVGLEYHEGTLTDSALSTLRLLDAVDRPAVHTYWQPPVGMPTARAIDDLATVFDRTCAVHCFSWWPARERLPLDARRDLWESVVRSLRTRPAPVDVLLEFVADDDPAAFARDVRVLRELV